ncbi:testis-expressed protein 49 isoform X2 [Oncorhynchus tshawytscha]|uniref:testis-expressed protein 49 isoform X2 n=1 Tax=Oncorhynchus tshawytscha TaxID=74940 RepID=UPI000D09CE61|nr:testis-expressed protein 49 isoform X2 [Oncorhynchus tshawytscha]
MLSWTASDCSWRRYLMAFFGITNLGYQNPIGDKMLVNPRASASHRAPNQLYSVPLTDSQQYGWWMPNGGQQNTQERWTQVRRFPRKNSEMTKFVKEMSMTDREFSLF